MPTYNRIQFVTGPHAKAHGVQEMHDGQEKRLLDLEGGEFDLKGEQYSYKLVEENVDPPWNSEQQIESPPPGVEFAPRPEPEPEEEPEVQPLPDEPEPEPEIDAPSDFVPAFIRTPPEKKRTVAKEKKKPVRRRK